MKNSIFIYFLILLLLSVPVSGAEVIMEEINGKQHLVLSSKDDLEVSGFKIIITYPQSLRVLSVIAVNPYMVEYNIQNDFGKTTIVGATGDTRGKSVLAEIQYSGEGEISIMVEKILDMDLKEIHVINAIKFISPKASPTPLPIYDARPVYYPPADSSSTDFVEEPFNVFNSATPPQKDVTSNKIIYDIEEPNSTKLNGKTNFNPNIEHDESVENEVIEVPTPLPTPETTPLGLGVIIGVIVGFLVFIMHKKVNE